MDTVCPECVGRKYCIMCEGSGRDRDDFGIGQCRTCHGHGYCAKCKGKGYVEVTLEVARRAGMAK